MHGPLHTSATLSTVLCQLFTKTQAPNLAVFLALPMGFEEYYWSRPLLLKTCRHIGAASMRLWKCRRQLHDITAHSHVSVDPGLAPLYLLGFFGLWTGLSFFQLACNVNTHKVESLKLGLKDVITARNFNPRTIVCTLAWGTLAAWIVDCVLLTRLTQRIFAGIAFNIFQSRLALSSKATG